uniref:Uncharacterized protein n=1 Tax=Anopheles coluzzii TaxID=1518534 RepID=A0A6E8WCC2_ANOCL
MEQKKPRPPGLIEPNKDSPFRILDVRTIQDNAPTLSYTVQEEEDAAEQSDGSSGSEKELVIDMPEEETDLAQVPVLAQELEIESKIIVPQIPETPPKTVASASRANRRKTQLVRMEEDADAVFDEAPPKPSSRKVTDELQEGIAANRHIMRQIALLRTTINCLVEARYHRSIPFPPDTSDFETMDSWMDAYEQMKWDTSISKSSKAKKKS